MRILVLIVLTFGLLAHAADDERGTVTSHDETAQRLAKFLKGRTLECPVRKFGRKIKLDAALSASGSVEFSVTEFGDNSLDIQSSGDWLIVSDPQADIEQYVFIRVYDDTMLSDDVTELPASWVFNNFTDKPESGAIYCRVLQK